MKIILKTIVFLVVLMSLTKSWAAVTFDSKTQGVGNTNPFTFSHTIAGSDKLLVISLEYRGEVVRSGGAPTYNAVTMTQVSTTCTRVVSGGIDLNTEIWYLVNP